jgi:hypothetical protein
MSFVPVILVWSRTPSSAEDAFHFVFTQRNNYSRRTAYWKLKRTLAKPKNFVTEQYYAHLRRSFCAPCQTSIVDPREPE